MLTSSKPEFLLGSEAIVDGMERLRSLPIFSEEACSFLQAVSDSIMRNRDAKAYPDVVTFAFWCRRANLQQMKKPYSAENMRFGRGIVFHIAPSNVPVNFAYSMAASILAGNASIVRVPSKEFPQVALICEAIEAALQKSPELKPYFCLVRYGHEKEINDAFSMICDVRVIWGGDGTIEAVRRSPLKARATEVVFADRYSIAVLNADVYLESRDKERVAKDFYNDTYLTDQNACTSPRIVVWLGKGMEEARKIFWESMDEVVRREGYDLQPVQAVDKLTKLCLLGAKKEARWRRDKDNTIMRAEVSCLDEDIMTYQGNSGFFLEYVAESLEEILPVCGERCQTLSYYGFSKETFERLVQQYRPKDIDRVVPLGRTMDFSLVWDGYDLVRAMSREVSIL